MLCFLFINTLPSIYALISSCMLTLYNRYCELKFREPISDDIRWVVTVPAIWGESAKQFMRLAAVKVNHFIKVMFICY